MGYLEARGKEERQQVLNTVKSRNVIEDVSVIRGAISKAEFLVRVNLLKEDSNRETYIDPQ